MDAITEFRILTHNSNAEFGNSLGSTTNIITRSGTNQIHGAVWEFFRNDVFDATNFFAAETEPLKQNQFGASAWGPSPQRQDFVFGFYEGFRNHQGETQIFHGPFRRRERLAISPRRARKVFLRLLQQS